MKSIPTLAHSFWSDVINQQKWKPLLEHILTFDTEKGSSAQTKTWLKRNSLLKACWFYLYRLNGWMKTGNLWEREGKKRKTYRGKHATCFSHVRTFMNPSVLAVWSLLSAAVSNTLRPPAVTDTLATITLFVLLLFCVFKRVLWISCSVLPAEAFSVRSGNPAPQRWHSTETRGLARKHQPALRTIQHLHITSPHSSSAALVQTI